MVRLAITLRSDFPLNDGGLFFSMARDLKRAHYALPGEKSYNGADLPFAYPPLGIYLAALADSALPAGLPPGDPVEWWHAGQPRQQRIQHPLPPPGTGHPPPELAQHSVGTSRVITGQAHTALPVHPGPPRLRRRGADLRGFSAHRSELELRNLTERIERGIGEQVRRRLRVAERHEHHVLRHVAVGADLDLDRAYRDVPELPLIPISAPMRLLRTSYVVFCL